MASKTKSTTTYNVKNKDKVAGTLYAKTGESVVTKRKGENHKISAGGDTINVAPGEAVQTETGGRGQRIFKQSDEAKLFDTGNINPTAPKDVEVSVVDGETSKQKQKTGTFVGDVINPALQKALEFMGGEFTREEKGDLKMTPKGAKRLITGAAIAGAVGPLVKYGGVALKGGSKAATKAGSSTARITRMKMAHEVSAKTGSLIPRGTVQTQRAFTVGKPPVPSNVMKMFKGKQINRSAARYAVNTKSKAGTISFLKRHGFTIGAAGTISAVATYPFAHFEIAEATDKLGMAMYKASEEGDVEAVAELKAYMEEIINPGLWGAILNKIPYLNIHRSVTKNLVAAEMSAKVMMEEAEKNLAVAQGERESQFMTERRLADEAAQKRKL